jgi:hypothetical protein
MTRKGYLGIGPWMVQEGDAVMLVAGADMPYLFRKTNGGTNEVSWRLVGELYVHGIMDGEALQAEDLEFETIRVV